MKTIHFILLSFFLLFSSLVFSQQNNVGINTTTPHSSAALQLKSKNNNQGILIPTLTTTQRTGITLPATGLLVYDSTTNSFWYYDGTSWVDIGNSSQIADPVDMDTYVAAFEGAGATDQIYFAIDNVGKWTMKGDRIEEFNNDSNIFIGKNAGANVTPSPGLGFGNTFFGTQSGESTTEGSHNVFLGTSSGVANTTGGSNTYLGYLSGKSNQTGSLNVFLGDRTGSKNTKGMNTMIGAVSGFENITGEGNVFLGVSSGYGELGSNKLYIENSSSSTPLIYGEFDNDLLRVNGTFNINNAFSFPTTDGAANQILATDGSGVLAWTTPSAGSAPTKIEDADMDTSVEAIDGAGNTDKIEFKVDGTSAWEMTKDRLEETNAGDNIFIGKSTGTATTTATESVFVGTNAGISNATGNANVYLGKDAGASNVAGTTNVYVGHSAGSAGGAGSNNTFLGGQAGALVTGSKNTYVGQLAGGGASSDGEGNVFLGFNAGQFETGDNKLFIENSSSPDPLIYGDFATDLLRVNGTLNINQAFSFPIADGLANQVLATDGSGNVAWSTPTAATPTKIEDADMDTSIEAIEGTGATDQLNFTVDDSIQWKMIKNRFEPGNVDGDVFIGKDAGKKDLPNSNGGNSLNSPNTFVGNFSGANNTYGHGNAFFGSNAGSTHVNGHRNTFIGIYSGNKHVNAFDNTFVGALSGSENIQGAFNTMIGSKAGLNNKYGGRNVFIGYNAGASELGSDKLYIDIADISTPLIYGEFDNDLLRINGTLNVNNAFSFPTTDGTANQILATDGSGNVAWSTPTAPIPTKIEDADMDTSVEAVEGAGATDEIDFKVDNTVQWKMVKDRLEPENFLGNIFVGIYTGKSTTTGGDNIFLGTFSGEGNTEGNRNTFIGLSTGRNNTEGAGNVFIGTGAGLTNETGASNVYLGNNSGQNSTGSNNVFIGNGAGAFELGSDKLYIDNGSINTPLIYGEFDNDLLRVNGTLNVNNAFSFPTSDGTANQVLATDGSGSLTWATPSSGGSSSKIEDSDMDTWVEAIDGSGPTDVIQFVVDGDPHWLMKKDRIEEVNSVGNIFIGQSAGNINTPNPSVGEGVRNTFIGSISGSSNSTGGGNTFLGNTAGFGSTTGGYNTFIGLEAGSANSTGNFNTLIGLSAGAANGAGVSNSILGSNAGIMLSGGEENVLLGAASANSMSSGNRNVFIGTGTGVSLPSGSDNVFIGNLAGALINSATDNTLIIENSSSAIPLIWGDFTSDLIGINRIATTNTLEVGGTLSTSDGLVHMNSDARLKKNIQPLDSKVILQRLLELKGINYEWNDTKTGQDRPEGTRFGFTAQNIQTVFPELVSEDNLGYLQTSYGNFDAMQIEALRALLNRIEKLENENQELKTALSDIETIKAEIAELKGIAKN